MAGSVDVPARPAMSVPAPSRTGEAPKRRTPPPGLNPASIAEDVGRLQELAAWERRDAQRQEVEQARLKALKASNWLAAEKAANDRRRMDTAAAALKKHLMRPGGLAEHAHSIHAPPEGPTPLDETPDAPQEEWAALWTTMAKEHEGAATSDSQPSRDRTAAAAAAGPPAAPAAWPACRKISAAGPAPRSRSRSRGP